MVRQALPSDFNFIHELYMHPDVNPYLLYEPMDKESFQPNYDDLIKRAVKFIYQQNEERIGMFKLVPMTHRSAHIVYLGGVAIHPHWFGKGEGKNMMNEIIAFCGSQGFLRIELSTAVSNLKAAKMYEQVGFQREGILRKYTRLQPGDQFLDEVLMSHII